MYAVDRTQRLALPGLLPALRDWRDASARRRAHPVALSELHRCADGAWVLVRARVQAGALLHGALHGTPGVFRRLVFVAGRATWLHERGIDFTAIDDADERALVWVGGGRLVAPHEELMEYPARCLAELEPPALDPTRPVSAREFVLKDGALVDILGHKVTAPDPSGASAGYRDLRQRVALRSSRAQALLLTPAS